MELYDEAAVIKINDLAQNAAKQIKEVAKLTDVPISVTGAGSMFRIHFRETPPNRYRDAYQNIEERAILDELLDYMFLKENVVMINTLACMLATTMTQNHIDQLSEALARGFKFVKPKIDKLLLEV